MQETAAGVQAATTPHLQRILSLWDLIYYGIILTSPIAAVPLFGEAQVLSHGHAVSTLLLAMVAMSVTAISFGRMANIYPSAGSVYTYVSRGVLRSYKQGMKRQSLYKQAELEALLQLRPSTDPSPITDPEHGDDRHNIPHAADWVPNV